MINFRKYLFYFAGLYLTLFSAALVVNYLVDPYRVFWSSDIIGEASKKPKAQSQIYFNKAVGIRENKPRTLLLGNSRVQWGLHAGSTEWPDSMRPVYNAGIPGSTTTTSLAYLEYALVAHHPETVVLGLDYFNFRIPDNVNSELFVVRGDYHKYLAIEGDETPLLLEQLKVLVSLDTLLDSAITLITRNDPFAMDIKPNGDNPVNEYIGYVNTKGHNKLFFESLDRALKALNRVRSIYPNGSNSSPEFEALRRIVEICDRNGIDLVLFVHPYHRTMINIIEANHASEFQSWVRQIEEIGLSSQSVQFWNFATQNSYIDEPVPDAGDNQSRMKWYWEPGHYKSTLGDRIIGNIFNLRDQFGHLVVDNLSTKHEGSN